MSTQAGDAPSGVRAAWRAAPTTPRLCRLAATADRTTIEAEADAVGQIGASPRLAAGLQVLAGRIDDAAALLTATDPLGWSRHDHPGTLVLPVLLLVAVSAHEPPPRFQVRSRCWRRLMSRDGTTCIISSRTHPTERSPVDENESPELSMLLVRSIHEPPITSDQRARWLGLARAVAEPR